MDSKTVFNRLLLYFQSHADKLGIAVEGTKIYKNKGDAGTVREHTLDKFLENHIPKRCGIINGGFVFDHKGHESKQIDLIITNDASLQFLNDSTTRKSFNSIEACNTVISVKSCLDKKQLIEAVDNLASMPPLSNIEVSSLVSNPEVMLSQIPQRVIFAYGGLKPRKLYEHLVKYINESKMPIGKIPQLIVVNNSYYIELSGNDGIPLIDGSILKPNTYGVWVKENNRYLGALALVHLLVRIQHISTLSPFVVVGWEPYLREMALTSEKKF